MMTSEKHTSPQDVPPSPEDASTASPHSGITAEQVSGAVLGRGRGIAGTVYGTVVVMATIVAAAADHSDWQLVAIVASTSLVIWVSHVYAHGIGESIERNRRLDWPEFRAIVGRQLPILAAAAAPTLVLIVGAADAVRENRTIWLALGIGWLTLAVQGARYAHVEHLGRLGTIAVIALNLMLGGIVVLLKVLID